MRVSFKRDSDQLAPCTNSSLEKELLEHSFYGTFREAHRGSDHLVAFALKDTLQDRFLALTEQGFEFAVLRALHSTLNDRLDGPGIEPHLAIRDSADRLSEL